MSDKFPHSHSHIYLETKNQLFFKDVKKLMWRHFNIPINDIQRPLCIRECVRYITKQDTKAKLLQVPLKYSSTLYRAELYRGQGNSSVNWGGGLYPPEISASERKVFEDHVKKERTAMDIEILNKRTENMEFRPWQEKCKEILKNSESDDRSVFWFVDMDGVSAVRWHNIWP